ncbi:CYTH domain-containing protein [Ideonella margarita]|uniref:CYTH domain-containing protein n=1 Tax=Ideonella margarita TaxID=2984191 RepID=A0ABU9BZR8_9BURK
MIEIELKFQVPTAARQAVQAEVKAHAGAACTRLQARYVDTPEQHLARARAALRLRREGPVWVQTLKAQGVDLLQRLEHNAPVDPADGDPPALRLARHAGTPALPALARALGCTDDAMNEAARTDNTLGLGVVFETDIRRGHAPLTVAPGSTVVELAFDDGEIRGGGRAQAVCELEMELLQGDVAGLLATAADWVQRHGLWLDVRSKAERGNLLAQGLQASPPQQPPAAIAGQPGHEAVSACLHAALRNAAVVADPAADQAAAPVAAPQAHTQALVAGLGRLHSLLSRHAAESGLAESLILWLAPLDVAGAAQTRAAGRLVRSAAFNQWVLGVLGWCAAQRPSA